MLRSGLTLPMTWTALPFARCASWGVLCQYAQLVSSTTRTAYAIEKYGHCPFGIEGCLVAAELRNFADEEDVTIDKAVEVGRGDARGRELLGHCRTQDKIRSGNVVRSGRPGELNANGSRRS